MKLCLEIVWQFLNSPWGITCTAAVVVWILNKVYSKKPLWKKYEGTVISAIKSVEKAIPDDTENKSLSKLNAALLCILKVVEPAEKRKLSAAETAELEQGISIKHAELEANGNL